MIPNSIGRNISKYFVAACLLGLAAAHGLAQTSDRPQSADDKFQISFENAEWRSVIEYFADKAGYTLHLRTNNYPPGTWTYHSNDFYTLGEILDIINHGLRIREDVYTLVRYKRMLVLIREKDGYPEDLIETVRPEDLDSRGLYETMRCEYDISDLRDTNIDRDASSIIDSRQNINYLQETGILIVTGKGEKLRVIRSLIEAARQRKISRSQQIKTYKLKHVTADELLIVVRGLMGLSENQNQFDDGSLIIRPQIFGDTIYLKGTAEKIDDFERIAAVVDVAEEITNDRPTEKPFLRTYPVTKDPLLTFKVVNTMLVGREITIDQDPETGTLIVRARSQDHDDIKDIIDTVNGASSSTTSIVLKNRTVSSAIEYLNLMFRQTEGETNRTGPVFYGDSSSDTLVILGKPQEIALAEELISKWDLTSGISSSSIRSTTRVIPVSEDQAWEVMEMLQDYWGTTNRPNRLNFVLPDQRDNFRRNRMLYPNGNSDQEQPQSSPSRGTDSLRNPSGNLFRSFPSKSSVFNWVIPEDELVPEDLSGYQFVSIGIVQDGQQSGVGRTSSETQDDDRAPGYRPPQEPISIPGSDITVRLGPAGIIIESKDLDAADDLEDLINSILKRSSDGELPTVFYLKYAKADEAKELLDKFLGISSSSGGGGGGGLGGMFGGMMSNMIGGAAGDMISGLMGGGGSGSGPATAEWLESTNIQTLFDVRLNTLFILGATSNDLAMITQLIDYIDQAEAPHDPNLIGETYVIPILFYPDVEALKKTIENLLKDYVQGESGGGGPGGQGGGQNPEAQIARAMQNAMRGATGGTAQKNPDELRPKGRLAQLDRLLIFTGPRNIYLEVMKIVQDVDKPDQNDFGAPQVYALESMDVVDMAKALKSLVPGIEIEGMPEDAASGLAGGRSGQGETTGQQGRGGQLGGRQSQGQQPTFQFPNIQFPNFGGGGGRGGQQGGGRGGPQQGGGRGGGNRGGGFF